MKKGIDCATPLTSDKAKAIAALGYRFVCRYLVPAKYAWKRLNRAEAEAISKAGMEVISVFETTANRPVGGAEAGKTDGILARQEAALIGQPKGSTIYFAVDYDAQAKDYNLIEQYLLAAQKELPGYDVGVYGSFAVIEEMAKRKACKKFWQTYAWSHGRKSNHANLFQYKNGQTLEGITLDLNEGYTNEGGWSTVAAETKVNTCTVILPSGAKVEGILLDGSSYIKVNDYAKEDHREVSWNATTKTVEVK